MSQGLRQKPRSQFDKGHETARGTAIFQAKFIVKHYSVFKDFAKSCKPAGWKEKKFKDMVEKLNRKEFLEMVEYNYMYEFYDAVSSKVFNIPGYKKEFYKGHKR